MSRINQMNERLCSIVEGQYVITDVADRLTQHGDRYKMLRLTDCTGDLGVYAWENSGLLEQISFLTPRPVQVSLYIRRFNGTVIADLRAIHTLEDHEVVNAASLLAHEDCPESALPALETLVEFVGTLEPAPLRGFLNRVLLDERIADSLLTCKGSMGHHHREPGGLLVHSAEVMRIAADMAGTRLSPLEVSIVQVAALLHDIGKLRAVGSGRVRPVHYSIVRHETQTNRLLEYHLEWLRARAPEIAAGLEYTLDYLAQPRASRGFAKFLGAELVASADQMSAALDNGKRLDDLLRKTLPQARLINQKSASVSPLLTRIH